MDEKFFNYTSFKKICRLLQKDSKWDGIKPLLQASALVIPALVCKETIATIGLTGILDQGLICIESNKIINNALKSISKIIKNTDDDYITRAENAQTANLLLVFSAYFDTVKMYLPDKNNNIYLEEVKYCLSEKSLKEYKKKLLAKSKETAKEDSLKIADWNILLPNFLEGFDEYEKRLKDFYLLLNNSFRYYLEGLSCTEGLQECLHEELNKRLKTIPEEAIKNYRRQYNSLAAICPDFFVLSNQHEHLTQSKQIDFGFTSLSNKIENIPEIINNYTANEALNTLKKWYKQNLKDTIIPTKDYISYEQNLQMPTREEIFIPQSYNWLIYKNGIPLETTCLWKNGGEIGVDILKILRSPELGSKPVLILGDPGAGKTMLCHMLAGKILCNEYHVIVLHLRNLNAEVSIAEQINQEIANSIDDTECRWIDIARAKAKKPILLIFDGYDELLQMEGKTYNNYLEKIVEFQEKQFKTHDIIVKSIVTSRIVLINKVEVPVGSTIIRLQPFDNNQISAWCEIWNKTNEQFFISENISKFEIKEGSKAWSLAGEPLLLLMLALFDTKNNALCKHQNLKETDLYNRLIHDFVEREKRKNKKFQEIDKTKQNKYIEKEIVRISVAALGMYNRNTLYLTADEFDKDLEELSYKSDTEYDLRDSEKIFGSFFFVHTVTTKSGDISENDRLTAYTFLHNTFGEFLTSYYIVLQLFDLLDDLKHNLDKYGDITNFTLKDRCNWYGCLCYAPLFRRPVISRMIREWAPIFFQKKNLKFEEAKILIQKFIEYELPRILRGEIFHELEMVIQKYPIHINRHEEDLIKLMSIYSNNILSLATLLADTLVFDKINNIIPNSWEKLLNMWRCSFDENDVASFAGQYAIKDIEGELFLVSQDSPADLQHESNRVTKLYHTYKNLHEEPESCILGALLGTEYKNVYSSLKIQNIKLEARSILLNIILGRAKKNRIKNRFSREEIKILKSYPKICLNEEDYSSLYAYFLVLNDIASFSKESAKFVYSLLGYEIFDVYAHCNRYCPTIIIPILELIDKLLPEINDRRLYNLISRLTVCDFENNISERVINLLAKILFKSITCIRRLLWLDSCWNLLSAAENYLDSDISVYSYETLETLCKLSIEANNLDPSFPIDFIDKAKNSIDFMLDERESINKILPLLKIINKYQLKKGDTNNYWLFEKISEALDFEDNLSDHSINDLATILLDESKGADKSAWLFACFGVLKNVMLHYSSENKVYSSETNKKIFLTIKEALKKDNTFYPDFFNEYLTLVSTHICETHQNISKSTTLLDNQMLIDDLQTLSIILNLKSNIFFDELEIKYVCTGVENILKKIKQKNGWYFDYFEENDIIIDLCNTLHMYSDETREYIFTLIIKYVKKFGMQLTIEQYQMLKDVANDFNCSSLLSELSYLTNVFNPSYDNF